MRVGGDRRFADVFQDLLHQDAGIRIVFDDQNVRTCAMWGRIFSRGNAHFFLYSDAEGEVARGGTVNVLSSYRILRMEALHLEECGAPGDEMAVDIRTGLVRQAAGGTVEQLRKEELCGFRPDVADLREDVAPSMHVQTVVMPLRVNVRVLPTRICKILVTPSN